MNAPTLLTLALSARFSASAVAQAIAIFPDEYVAVPDGPFNSPNLPFANGASRAMCLYEAIDIDVPSGHQITKLGFRQDATLTTIDTGRIINLEIRIGYSTLKANTMTTDFANNYAQPPVTVFGPANITLPNLRDVNNPLVNGRFFITLATPFTYVPAGQSLIVEYRCFGNSGGSSPFNYRLDRADYYSPVTYGPAGCPHSGGGTPLITVQPLRPGLQYQCAMTGGPGNAPGLLMLQTGQPMVTPYPLSLAIPGINPLCTGQISPVGLITLGTVSGASGTANWNFPVPNNPIFADFFLSSQAVFFDLFAPGGLVVSQGSQVLTGALPRSTMLVAAGSPLAATTGTLSLNYCPVAFFEHQ